MSALSPKRVIFVKYYHFCQVISRTVSFVIIALVNKFSQLSICVQ